MLEAKSLVRSYGDFKAVDDVSFTIGDGQIVGLLGHNGAGKTTIMKMLSGYLEPDQGSVFFDGRDIADDLTSFQHHLGYLPESLPVYQDMVVADYLDYAADLKGMSPSEKRPEIKRVVQETGIQEKILSPIATLSRGYKQRVGVAQAILGNPKLLILDEPTNGLDPSQTEQMRTLIRQVAQRNLARVANRLGSPSGLSLLPGGPQARPGTLPSLGATRLRFGRLGLRGLQA